MLNTNNRIGAGAIDREKASQPNTAGSVYWVFSLGVDWSIHQSICSRQTKFSFARQSQVLLS